MKGKQEIFIGGRLKIEIDLPTLLEATHSLGDIIQKLPSLNARDTQEQLIVVWKKLHKLSGVENEPLRVFKCSRCGKETDRRGAHIDKGPNAFADLCEECADREFGGWVLK